MWPFNAAASWRRADVRTALCVLRLLVGGIGMHLMSHVLPRHLALAERQFGAAHRED